MKDIFAKNLMELNGQIAEVCEEYDRDADDITIVAVTKTFPAAAISIAVASGIFNIGESRLQDAEPKILELGQIARYHMIGHLQTNKVKKVVELFDCIQSVDSIKLAEEISKRAGEFNRTIECFVEVNSSEEPQKNGVSIADTIDLVKQIYQLPNIKLTGLMTIGPHTDNEEKICTAFKRCRELFKAGQQIVGNDFDNLSMGMSSDFKLAIKEGSTMIRVGTGLFGPREKAF
ncbi:MAG TPA: YggS family pyridoxal phosphate-dependent enzyme [candidate division Zixibacteria bacterium]|nr:YggS family pyridoxal phosphate-dependent enzyme [candidate division Zixibacteria bacterium]